MLSIRTLSKDLLGWPKTSFGENPNKVFLLTQYKSKRLIPVWQNYGSYRRLRTEGNVGPGEASSDHWLRVSFAGKTGPVKWPCPPPVNCRHTYRTSLWHEPILHYYSNSFLLILVGWKKSALPYCYKLVLFQARVFMSVSILSRMHFMTNSSQCFSCEPT